MSVTFKLVLLMIVGVSVADFTFMRDVRDDLGSRECADKVTKCNRLATNTNPPRYVEVTNKQYRFNPEAIDIWCREAGVILPCIDREISEDECDIVNSKIRAARRFYNFVCLNNNTEVKNLLFCVNDLEKTILQIRFGACASTVIGNLETLTELETAGVSIPAYVKERYRCSLSDLCSLPGLSCLDVGKWTHLSLNTFELKTQSKAYQSFERCADVIGTPSLCGEKSKNVLVELMRTGFLTKIYYGLDMDVC